MVGFSARERLAIAMKGFFSLTVGVCVLTVTMFAGRLQATGTFDDLTLSANSYWNGESKWQADGSPYPPTPAESPYNYDEGFASCGMEFSNRFTATTYGEESPYLYYTSWSGFAYSNMTDTTTAGYTNQYSVYTGAAYDGSNFGVGFYASWGGMIPSITFASVSAPQSLMMTNTTYTALSLLNGDSFSSPMAEGDWFKVTISAKDAAGNATGSDIDVMLAEWEAGGDLYIADEWLNVDLTSLGTDVKTIEFTVNASSYDWPTYFAIDSVTVPEPLTLCLLTLGSLAMLRRKKGKK
ncbi:MAG TPA: DUF4465 domain-containing protein [Phycisphaerae bacterium]|nr:DUF4465 domain-containing protein [Phycisphaerae bacterium]